MKTYQYQIGKRVINITGIDRDETDMKALAWRDRYAKKCIVSYNYRVK